MDRKEYLRRYISESIDRDLLQGAGREEKYKYYFGVPHAHTSYSDGRGTPYEACEKLRNMGLDYFIVADHSNQLDGVVNNNFDFDRELNEYVEREGTSWHKTGRELEEINNKYKDFLAIRGFEMSSSLWGHFNVINSDTYVEAKNQMKNIDDFFNWIRSKDNIVVVINHPHKHFKLLDYDEELDKLIDLIEVANGSPPREYRRLEKYFYKMLDMGWHLGAVNGQDNHRANWGDKDNLTVVVSEELSREAFIDALKARRTYSTETRSLRLKFKANGRWMGAIVKVYPGDEINFEIEAEDVEVPIKKLQLITRGGRVVLEKEFKRAARAVWAPCLEVRDGEDWYVLKVVHRDGRWGISSPIFIK